MTFTKMANLNTLDHPTLRRRANLTWRAVSRAGEHPCDRPRSDDIEKSVTHRLHCAMPLSGNFAIQAKGLLQSSLNLHFLLGTIFFNGGFAISYQIIWKTENAGDYPIGIHHPWHVTKGLCKVKQIPKIQKKIGSGWVGPGLIWIKKNWKIVQKQSFASVQFAPC